jgi:excisionase family DNA binding protein
MEKLWTTTEVAQYLNIADRDVELLVKEGKLTGYKLGGKFLRFRPDQVQALKGVVTPRVQDDPAGASAAEPVRSRVREFLYFYDFYILSSVLLVSVVVYLMASGRG